MKFGLVSAAEMLELLGTARGWASLPTGWEGSPGWQGCLEGLCWMRKRPVASVIPHARQGPG